MLLRELVWFDNKLFVKQQYELLGLTGAIQIRRACEDFSST